LANEKYGIENSYLTSYPLGLIAEFKIIDNMPICTLCKPRQIFIQECEFEEHLIGVHDTSLKELKIMASITA